MRRLLPVLIGILVLSFSSLAFASSSKDGGNEKTCPRKNLPDSSSFDILKSLQGSWKGTHEENGRKKAIHVRYKVTSGGTAVEETLFPGTPHEMVSMYAVPLQDGKVQMVHYCSVGNQPHMKEQSSRNGQIVLKFVDSPGINPKKDAYMGGLTLTLKDSKHLEQDWTMLQGGKAVHTEEFSFVREK